MTVLNRVYQRPVDYEARRAVAARLAAPALPDNAIVERQYDAGWPADHEGLAAIRRLGAEGCVLVGEPAYYSRFRFTQMPQLVLPGVPAEYFLSLSMGERRPQGVVSLHAAFLVSG